MIVHCCSTLCQPKCIPVRNVSWCKKNSLCQNLQLYSSLISVRVNKFVEGSSGRLNQDRFEVVEHSALNSLNTLSLKFCYFERKTREYLKSSFFTTTFLFRLSVFPVELWTFSILVSFLFFSFNPKTFQEALKFVTSFDIDLTTCCLL